MTLHTHTPKCPYPVSTLRFLRYSPDKFSNSRSLRQGERSNQGHTMTLHTYTPSLPIMNFLHIMVSETQPGQTFPTAPLNAHLYTTGEKNTHTITGCWVKTTSTICTFYISLERYFCSPVYMAMHFY